MKALFLRLAVAALICVVQSQSRGRSPMRMHQASRRQHKAEDISGREALAMVMITLKQVQDLFEKYQWKDLSTYPDLSVKLPSHEQIHADAHLTSEVQRGHPWIVLQFPPKKPKKPEGKPKSYFDQSYRRPQYAAASPPVPRPIPPPRTGRQGPPFPSVRRT